MSYTIGIKRRFLPGYQKVKVTGHDWQHGRFILNREDGSQDHIPGFSTPRLKVYADFWTHLAQVERSRPVPKPEPEKAVVNEVQWQEPVPPPQRELSEVEKRAAQRVRDIYASNGSELAV